MNKTSLFVIFISLVCLVCGCFWEKEGLLPGVMTEDGRGSLGMSIQFSDQGKVLAKAPAGVVKIRIGLAGDSFSALFDASYGGGVIEGVPVGSHTVTATGLNSDGVAIFYGESSATVAAGKVTSVNVFLSSLGGMNIENNAPSTGTLTVTLYMSSTGSTQMMISNDSMFSGAVWEAYATTKSWSLAPGLDGTRTVYAKFKDGSGNESLPVSDTIYYSLGGPTPILVDRFAPGITEDGNTWATAYTSLQAALNVADSGDEVWISSGDYTPEVDSSGNVPGDDRMKTFLIPDGVALYGGFSGYNGSQETSLAARDWIANEAILCGDIGTIMDPWDNCYHVVTSGNCTLDGIQVSNGTANSSYPNNEGAGIYCFAAMAPVINNCVISHNDAVGSGGGLFCDTTCNITGTTFEWNSAGINGGAINTGGELILNGCRFYRNSAATGGAIYNDGVSAIGTYTSCEFRENSASGAGGGVFNMAVSNLSLSNVLFFSNEATSGGGMYCDDATVSLTGCDFVWNRGDNGAGLVNATGPIDILNTNFTNNNAANDGGAIFCWSTAYTKITGGQFTTNGATSGWGGAIKGEDPTCTVSVRNAEFISNTAVYGGAIAMDTAVLECQATAFRTNSAWGGGAVKTYDSPVGIVNCIFEVNDANDNGSMGGGAVLIEESLGSEIFPAVSGCVFDRNLSASYGGGISFAGMINVEINGCTFYGNSAATYGGGVYCSADVTNLTVRNSIMWADGATTDGNEVMSDSSSGNLNFGYSCVNGGYNGANVLLSGAGSIIDLGGNILSNPDFTASGTPGGLLPNAFSPVIDCADGDSKIPDTYDIDQNAGTTDLPYDVRGSSYSRYVDDGSVGNSGFGTPDYLDMGAYER